MAVASIVASLRSGGGGGGERNVGTGEGMKKTLGIFCEREGTPLQGLCPAATRGAKKKKKKEKNRIPAEKVLGILGHKQVTAKATIPEGKWQLCARV